MRSFALFFPLVFASLGAGNAIDAGKCTPGSTHGSCQGVTDDEAVLLQGKIIQDVVDTQANDDAQDPDYGDGDGDGDGPTAAPSEDEDGNKEAADNAAKLAAKAKSAKAAAKWAAKIVKKEKVKAEAEIGAASQKIDGLRKKLNDAKVAANKLLTADKLKMRVDKAMKAADDKAAKKAAAKAAAAAEAVIAPPDEEEELLIKDEAAELEDSEDEIEDSSEIAKVMDVCKPCDAACHMQTSKVTFVECDADKNDKLTITEVRECMLDSEKQTQKQSNYSLLVTSELITELTTEAERFVADHDEDQDNQLTQDEFLKSIVPCGASFVDKSIASGTAVASCVSSSTKRCQKTSKQQSCSLLQTEEEDQVEGRRRRRGGIGKVVKNVRKVAKKVVTCIWKTVKTWANCLAQAIPSFKDCWSNVVKSVSGSYMNLISDCSSLDKCKSQLLAGPKKLLDQLATEANNAVEPLVSSGTLSTASKTVEKVLSRTKTVAGEVKSAAGDVGKGIVDVVKGVSEAIKSVNLDFCSASGKGLWSFAPTDCGAFNRMKDIFRSSVTKIPAIFKDVGKKFGQCVAKSAIFSIPTPFVDLKISQWCVPSAIQTPIKGLIGTMQYINGLLKGGKSCSGAICNMGKSIQDIGTKFKTVFDSYALLEQANEVVGSTLHGDASEAGGRRRRRKTDCKGSDFEIFVSLNGQLDFPLIASSVAVSLTFTQGCLNKKYFWDIYIGIGVERFIAGVLLEGVADYAEVGAGISVGFNVGSAWDGGKGTQWGASVNLNGEAEWNGAAAGLGLGFAILPDPAYPTGFSVSPAIEGSSAPALNQRKTRNQEIKAAMAQHDTVEDQFYAGTGTLLNQFKNLDLTALVETGKLMSAVREGATGMKAGTNRSAAWPVISELTLTAALEVKWCLSC